MRQLYTSYKRTWRRVAAPEQVLRNGGWDRADEDLGWLTNDDVRSLTSTNKQAPAKGQRVIDVTVYKRMRCSIITRAHSPRSSKVTFSLILAKSSRITIFGKCSTRTPLIGLRKPYKTPPAQSMGVFSSLDFCFCDGPAFCSCPPVIVLFWNKK